MIDETHDPALACWVQSAAGHPDFPVQNLPYGIFAPADGSPRAGVAIGDAILDLAALAATRMLPPDVASAFAQPTLNALFALPTSARRALRKTLSRFLSDPSHQSLLGPILHETSGCTLHLPCMIGDYTDFYAGIHHANNVGSLYRPDQPLTENYKHLPVGYHGRASSVRPSGTAVVRPCGQILRGAAPVYGISRNLDYELEIGVWIGPGNALGAPVAISDAPAQIAGLCLLNDWSARDVQHWERLPLGPFLGKSFLTSVSPWVVTAEALEPFRIAPELRPSGDPAPLPHLSDTGDTTRGQFAITLEAHLLTPAMRAAGAAPARLSRARACDMYWTVAQMITHQTSNGCNLRPGDLLGTGTISPPGHQEAGSLLEITRDGAAPVTLPNGETRRFLEDGDEVILSAAAEAEGYIPIGFGTCRGIIHPANPA